MFTNLESFLANTVCRMSSWELPCFSEIHSFWHVFASVITYFSNPMYLAKTLVFFTACLYLSIVGQNTILTCNLYRITYLLFETKKRQMAYFTNKIWAIYLMYVEM